MSPNDFTCLDANCNFISIARLLEVVRIPSLLWVLLWYTAVSAINGYLRFLSSVSMMSILPLDLQENGAKSTLVEIRAAAAAAAGTTALDTYIKGLQSSNYLHHVECARRKRLFVHSKKAGHHFF